MTRAISLLTVLLGLAAALTLAVAPAPALGLSGDGVARAQARLDDLGCHAGRPDGEFGRPGWAAIIRFQSRHGLPQTARLDARTRQRLYSPDAHRCDRRPVPARSGQGRRIVVSQHQNWAWLVGPKGGVVAQGGTVDNPGVLHKGSYAVGSYCGRAARIARNTTTSGTVWLDHFVRFAPCGIGFHRIPRDRSSGRQIHPDWVLGTNLAASHGCVRLSREMAERVWRFTTRRTPVRVV